MSNETGDAIFVGKKPSIRCVSVILAAIPLVIILSERFSVYHVNVAQIVSRTKSVFMIVCIKTLESLTSTDGKNRNFPIVEFPLKRTIQTR